MLSGYLFRYVWSLDFFLLYIVSFNKLHNQYKEAVVNIHQLFFDTMNEISFFFFTKSGMLTTNNDKRNILTHTAIVLI